MFIFSRKTIHTFPGKNLSGNTILFTIFLTLALTLFSPAAHSASKTILVLGDSLSAEYGIARGTGWVALLEKRLQQEPRTLSERVTVVNASISGETSSGGKTRLSALLSKYHPAIVIIELGANDALRGLALKASETNFRDMIQLSTQANAKVLLVGMRIPPNYGRDYTEQFFTMYARVAKDTHTVLLPFFLEGLADKPELFQPDRLHLLAAAHPMILNNVWPYLHRLMTIPNKKTS